MTLYESARRWMLRVALKEEYIGAGQEINRTKLAEDCADALNLYNDSPDTVVAEIPDWIFDLAHEIAEEWER